jgi:arabinan endo-1,5-alpha-L-arabinosidase
MDNRLARRARRRWREPRSRVTRAEMVLLVVVALVLAGAGILATSAGGAVGYEPPVTRTPDAPALIIATIRHTDLSGGSLQTEDGHYLLFTSTAFGDKHDNVPVFVGRPGAWAAPVDALPVVPPWALPVAQGGTTWQPEVDRFGSQYVLYYAATVSGSQPRIHCLATATSASMIGPYVPTALPIVCQTNEGGDIDAQVLMDNTSPPRPYLVWKSDNNSGPNHGADRIWSQPLAANGLSVLGSPTVIYGTHAAPKWAHPIVEAPQMVTSPFGGWWLFYSGGDGFGGPLYGIGVAKCRSITGPCTPFGTKPLIMNNRQGVGAGEETLYRAATGSLWMLYAPWHGNIPYKWFQPVAAARIGWTPAGPYLAEAGSFPSP